MRLIDADALRDVLPKRLHNAYEQLAPLHGYVTRPESAVPWEQVPEPNRTLMIAAVSLALDAAPTIRCDGCEHWWLDVHMVDGTKPCRLGVQFPPTNWPAPDDGCVHYRPKPAPDPAEAEE